jgi:hypothetical protein
MATNLSIRIGTMACAHIKSNPARSFAYSFASIRDSEHKNLRHNGDLIGLHFFGLGMSRIACVQNSLALIAILALMLAWSDACLANTKTNAPAATKSVAAVGAPKAVSNVSATSTSSAAPCAWEWLCDGLGTCQQTPICRELNSDIGMPPGGVAPKAPHALPPEKAPRQMKGLQCKHVQRQRADTKRWRWEEICYCADRSAAISTSTLLPGLSQCAAVPASAQPSVQSRAQPSASTATQTRAQ